jgi:replication initiation protein RepC
LKKVKDMQTHVMTTPFGRRPVSLALLKGQVDAAATDVGRPVDKWKIFRDLSQAREKLGLQDRSLAVLHALLSFYPHPELCVTKGLVVFPSNAQLSLRAHGIAGTTLRRHLAALVDAGLIHRRDSPNGKRYARRRASGQIDHAFGFSLLPMLTRAGELAELAQSVAAERRALSEAREALSLCRRDIRKLLAVAVDSGIEGHFADLQARLETVLQPLPRRACVERVRLALDALCRLRAEIVNLLECHLNCAEVAGSERRNGCHIQNPETESIIDSEAARATNVLDVVTASEELPARQPSGGGCDLPLSVILKACPDIADYGPGGEIRSWSDFTRAAIVVRSMLGVSSTAYDEACAAIGPTNAATAMACILMRVDKIRVPGAYLRELTQRARRDGFSPAPMVMALVRSPGSGAAANARPELLSETMRRDEPIERRQQLFAGLRQRSAVIDRDAPVLLGNGKRLTADKPRRDVVLGFPAAGLEAAGKDLRARHDVDDEQARK